MGNVRLYQPGKAEFERLVQHWVDRCGHHVYDLRRRTLADAARLARTVVSETVPGGFASSAARSPGQRTNSKARPG